MINNKIFLGMLGTIPNRVIISVGLFLLDEVVDGFIGNALDWQSEGHSFVPSRPLQSSFLAR